MLRYGIKREAVERNVVRDLDRDDRPGTVRASEPRYLTGDELDRLLAGLGDTFRPIGACCTFAALRISETLGLGWRDLDFKAETLTVRSQLGRDGSLVPLKSAASAATVPMQPALVRELREHRARQVSRDLRRVHADALVFATAAGAPQSRRNALRAVRAAGDAAGLNDGREPVGLHDLRHSFVALALDAGASLAETARSPGTRTRALRRPCMWGWPTTGSRRRPRSCSPPDSAHERNRYRVADRLRGWLVNRRAPGRNDPHYGHNGHTRPDG